MSTSLLGSIELDLELDWAKSLILWDIKIIVLVRDVIEVLGSFLAWSEREPSSFVNQYAAKTREEPDEVSSAKTQSKNTSKRERNNK